MIFVVTLVGSIVIMAMDGKADTFPIGEGIKIEDQTNSGFLGTAMSAGCRSLNGTIWHFSMEYTDSSHRAVLANYSMDNGLTWGGFEIIDETDPGFSGVGYPYCIQDAVVLSNNSIIVLAHFYAHDTADKYELHVLQNWNGSDPTDWEQSTIYSDPTYYPDRDFASMCVNSTDILMVCWERDGGSTVHHDIYNPASRTVTPAEGTGSSTDKFGPWALVNSTDVFIYAWAFNPGVGQKLFFSTHAEDSLYEASFSTNYGPSDVVIALDDTFVWTSVYYTANGWIELRYWNATGEGSTQISSAPKYTHAQLGLTNMSETWIIVQAYDSSVDELMFWGHNYYEPPGMWQSTETTFFLETDDVIDYPSWLPHAIYPRLKDYQTDAMNYTQLPATGVFLYFVERDDGVDYDFYCYHTSIYSWPEIPYWTYDPYLVPEEPEPEPEPGALIDIPCFTSGLIILVIGIFLISLIVVVLDAI